jgi:hypothetical protein
MAPQSFWCRITRPMAWLTALLADWTYHAWPESLFRETGPVPAVKAADDVPESILIAWACGVSVEVSRGPFGFMASSRCCFFSTIQGSK